MITLCGHMKTLLQELELSSSKRIGGFHPGRFYLMDLKRGVKLEDIRDLEDIGAWQEEKGSLETNIRDDVDRKEECLRMKRRVCREINRLRM